MTTLRDAFLSAEDLDLKNLSDAELAAVWTAWLQQAQATNELDQHGYSHGVFIREPPWNCNDWPASGQDCSSERSAPPTGESAHQA